MLSDLHHIWNHTENPGIGIETENQYILTRHAFLEGWLKYATKTKNLFQFQAFENSCFVATYVPHPSLCETTLDHH